MPAAVGPPLSGAVPVQAANSEPMPPADKARTPPPPPAEHLASSALERCDFSEQTAVSILSHAFQRPVLNRRGRTLGHALETEYFCVGLFHNRSAWGLTSYCQSMPTVVHYLNAFLSDHALEGRWYAIAVSANVATEPHQDSRNDPGSLNVLISLGKVSGGGTWIAQPGGRALRAVSPHNTCVPGQVQDSRMKAIFFKPQVWHACAPWSGFRSVLTGCTVIRLRVPMLRVVMMFTTACACCVSGRPGPFGFPRPPAPPAPRRVQCQQP